MATHGTAPVNSGLFAEYASAVIRQLPRDVDPKVAQHWIENQAELAGVLRQALSWNVVPGVGITYSVTVNYDQTLEEMIAAGKYDWKNSDINAKNFPIKGCKNLSWTNVQIVLAHFDRTMRSDEVRRELYKQGLRPATLPELLAFGAKYPEKQQEFPIVALGSVWRDIRDVPYLRVMASGRALELAWFECMWDADYRFAAVRK